MDEKKIKKLKIKTADGKDYMLAYDRNSCARMSRKGFKIEDVADKPVIGIPMLVAGAFIKFHPELTQAQIDAMWENVSDKEGLLYKLIEMYQEPIDSLLEEPKDEAKNSTWEVVD